MPPSKSKRAIILDTDDEEDLFSDPETSSEEENEWIPKFAGDKGKGRAMPPADAKDKGKATRTDDGDNNNDDNDDDDDDYASDVSSVDLVDIPRDHDVQKISRVDKGKGRAM